MTNLRADPAVTGTGDRSRPRAALPALCATQITSWGIVHYAFPVLDPQITASTGWCSTTTTAAFSGALLVPAATGIPVGRILDRRGPRAVMTTGSLLGVVVVPAIAYAPDLIAFSAAWLLTGIAMAATLYQPAFAVLTRWWGEDRVRALTIVTIAGGLASTAFAPLTAALKGRFSFTTEGVRGDDAIEALADLLMGSPAPLLGAALVPGALIGIVVRRGSGGRRPDG
ncbi:MFS transporter [Streptomyces sp. MBT53]|nr:MFS transporter [Streptomyces sp. MBT53]